MFRELRATVLDFPDVSTRPTPSLLPKVATRPRALILLGPDLVRAGASAAMPRLRRMLTESREDPSHTEIRVSAAGALWAMGEYTAITGDWLRFAGVQDLTRDNFVTTLSQ